MCKQSNKSQVPKLIITYWKKGYNITIRAISRLYNGRPKFGCNVYLTQ